jgi:hypothetical protein
MATDVGAGPARTYAPGPALPTLVLQYVVSNLGYTGRAADVVGRATHDHKGHSQGLLIVCRRAHSAFAPEALTELPSWAMRLPCIAAEE